jgi:hypothetical protein
METGIEFADFRRLLERLENTDGLIRLRTSGEAWTPFAKLILLSDNAMILQPADDRRMIVNIRDVVEFELEQPVNICRADCIYTVTVEG